MKHLFALLVLLAPLTSLRADLIHIPDDYATIQAGLDASVDGDTVLVAHGTWMENVIIRSKNVVLASQYILDQNPAHVLETIIDGSNGADSDTGSTVLFHDITGTGAALIGFTIQGGGGSRISGAADRPREGGGILLWNPSMRTETNVRVESNLIRDNHVARIGGVSYYGGGGLSTWRIHLICKGNYFLNNGSDQYVGGLVTNFGTIELTNNLFVGNHSRSTFGGGAAIFLYQGGDSLLVENNTFSGNHVTDGGSGNVFMISSNAHATYRNNIMTELNNLIGIVSGATLDVSYSLTPTVIPWPGDGNVADTARFVEDSFVLQSDSPGVDMGNPDPLYNDPASAAPEVARFPAQGMLRSDMGVYGGMGAPMHELFVAMENSIRSEADPGLTKGYHLSPAYPNPFNATARFSLTLPSAQPVVLSVYNLVGQEVARLTDQPLAAGVHTYALNSTSWPSGTYFISASLGEGGSFHQRITLLK